MRIFSNLAISLDGKIADKKDPRKLLGTSLDKQTMFKIRKMSDAIVVGAKTLDVVGDPAYLRKKVSRHPANVIITASGNLNSDAKIWNHPEVIRYVFTIEASMAKVLDKVKDRAFVVSCGKGTQVDLRAAMKHLQVCGYKNVLVEGGGELIASFLEAQLLQEMYVTLTPHLLGGRENPALVGGEGLLPWAQLDMKQMKRVKNEVYFHWKVKGFKRV